ncbi:hypothetical protein OHB49_44655 (plasmid) [Streptomyces sp. NBC_01717]|uniref:hypothetical protein n=1 Tax=Streptomyces sp. NBC_01717 TaxID=2975918 RepID=UPI002E2F6361|nr:hypothetical protein [Streptomyces sp. NBC_01717]
MQGLGGGVGCERVEDFDEVPIGIRVAVAPSVGRGGLLGNKLADGCQPALVPNEEDRLADRPLTEGVDLVAQLLDLPVPDAEYGVGNGVPLRALPEPYQLTEV